MTRATPAAAPSAHSLILAAQPRCVIFFSGLARGQSNPTVLRWRFDSDEAYDPIPHPYVEGLLYLVGLSQGCVSFSL